MVAAFLRQCQWKSETRFRFFEQSAVRSDHKELTFGRRNNLATEGGPRGDQGVHTNDLPVEARESYRGATEGVLFEPIQPVPDNLGSEVGVGHGSIELQASKNVVIDIGNNVNAELSWHCLDPGLACLATCLRTNLCGI